MHQRATRPRVECVLLAYHGCTVTRSYVVQREEYVDFTAVELPIVVSELRAHRALVGSRVQWRSSTSGVSYRNEIFVDVQVFLADEFTAVAQPARVVDETFECVSCLDNVLQVHAPWRHVSVHIILPVNTTVPFLRL
jgi:hypothetical protein